MALIKSDIVVGRDVDGARGVVVGRCRRWWMVAVRRRDGTGSVSNTLLYLGGTQLTSQYPLGTIPPNLRQPFLLSRFISHSAHPISHPILPLNPPMPTPIRLKISHRTPYIFPPPITPHFPVTPVFWARVSWYPAPAALLPNTLTRTTATLGSSIHPSTLPTIIL